MCNPSHGLDDFRFGLVNPCLGLTFCSFRKWELVKKSGVFVLFMLVFGTGIDHRSSEVDYGFNVKLLQPAAVIRYNLFH